jgi:hypothetical protein
MQFLQTIDSLLDEHCRTRWGHGAFSKTTCERFAAIWTTILAEQQKSIERDRALLVARCGDRTRESDLRRVSAVAGEFLFAITAATTARRAQLSSGLAAMLRTASDIDDIEQRERERVRGRDRLSSLRSKSLQLQTATAFASGDDSGITRSVLANTNTLPPTIFKRTTVL